MFFEGGGCLNWKRLAVVFFTKTPVQTAAAPSDSSRADSGSAGTRVTDARVHAISEFLIYLLINDRFASQLLSPLHNNNNVDK